MITVKQIERAWTARQYERLFRDLVACRVEASLKLEFDGGWATPAAAMALVRMDELSQSYVPAYGKLLRAILAAQQVDGGWGDLGTTALCLRALLCSNGHGLAIDQGMEFLATLQKPEGLWPRFPLRRMPEDPAISAFILLQLGGHAAFQSAVRLADALAWFELNAPFLDAQTRELYDRAARRCRVAAAATTTAPRADAQLVESWS
jgi:hypothetical protein